jgi:SAM-dependent methyltransferase
VYDRWYGDDPDTVACVDRLRRWAGPGPVLELGVGTGRLALPLAATGLEVRGIDASASMVERLRAKPGGEALAVTVGDMAEGPPPLRAGETPEGLFALVYVSYNTFFNLHDHDAQRRCLERVRRWLAPSGCLVVEAFVPDLDPDADGVPVPHRTEPGAEVWSAARVDVAGQVVEGRFWETDGRGGRWRPWRIHYLWPVQLDALALACGLVPAGRWAGWRDEPFTEDSARHVSCYEVAAAG